MQGDAVKFTVESLHLDPEYRIRNQNPDLHEYKTLDQDPHKDFCRSENLDNTGSFHNLRARERVGKDDSLGS